MNISNKWIDYECLKTGNGEKLERWGDIVLRRPDPQVMWPIKNESGLWKNPHGHYHRSAKGGGHWETKKKYPQKWTVNYHGLKFNISPTGFKHTGLFPEQAANWDWQMDMIKKANRPIKVLNLFAYTGGATVACAAAGAEVCHVDASKGMVTWAKEIGYPVLVRPSYVLGGQGMEITYNEAKLKAYLDSAFERDSKNPVLIDKYLVGREIEVDAICDGENVLIPGIMEHLERAGVHSGDSITMYPPNYLTNLMYYITLINFILGILKSLYTLLT